MANLKNIRSQIKSVTSIQKVTKAMKMVAAAKLRKSQENMEKARPYSERIKDLIASLINDVDTSLLPLLEQPSNSGNYGFVIITADRGLAGSFNSNIIKEAEVAIKNCGKQKKAGPGARRARQPAFFCFVLLAFCIFGIFIDFLHCFWLVLSLT